MLLVLKMNAFSAALILLVCIGYARGAQQPSGDQRTKPSTGMIDGFVIMSATRSAVESVRVDLSGGSKNVIRRTVTTGADGAFAFKDLTDGVYFVSAEEEGYGTGVSASMRRVSLHAGEQLRIDLSLRKMASIAGRVLDQEGVGISGLRVGAWVSTFRYGRPFVMFRGFARTNDAGGYQINNLRGGMYFVGIIPPLLKPAQGMMLQSASENPAVYKTEFYPDSDTLSDASSVPVEEEQQVSQIDLQGRRTKGYCVSASLPNWLERETGRISVSIAQSGSKTRTAIGTGMLLNNARSFHFCGVPTGYYNLSVSVTQNQEHTDWFGMESVEVGKRNVAIEALELFRPVRLEATIKVDGQQLVKALPTSMGLHLEPVDRLPFADEDLYSHLESDGKAAFSKLFPGEYWVDDDGASAGYYITAMSAGSRDALMQPIKVGDGDLKITVRCDGASLSGSVTADRRIETLEPAVMALVRSTGGGLVWTAGLDQDNRFRFSNIPPGTYKALALFGIGQEGAQDPMIVSRFLPQAQEVILSPSAAKEIELYPTLAR